MNTEELHGCIYANNGPDEVFIVDCLLAFL